MGLRLKQSTQSALKIARWLEQRSEVAHVLCPMLESDPGFKIWNRDFKGDAVCLALCFVEGMKKRGPPGR